MFSLAVNMSSTLWLFFSTFAQSYNYESRVHSHTNCKTKTMHEKRQGYENSKLHWSKLKSKDPSLHDINDEPTQ